MLQASGVYDDLERKQYLRSGFTLFVPVDSAFAEIPPSFELQSLPSDQKILVLKGHILPVFYPLSLLLATNNPKEVTLASDVIGSAFTLNMSSFNGTISLGTGTIEAVITRTVLDEQPISIFAISKVLLPKEIFGKNPMVFPPPPPSPLPPAIDGKDVSSEVVDTQMWLVVFLALDFFLTVLIIYSMHLVARIR
ncbi:fasciclin-like arabinogalactan protein 4-like [Trifolium medium]|uniref:Fasciclin-like arabinogalactan protein 4-like n=1 Tax=Trifolium medium TaxID=97028 RepID=A0A392LYT7_9FABA|nr:fasciclin-like arabinogalactan protein 4-like [Trifolium medium]